MPSKSAAQARLMRAVAHGWKKPGGGGPTMEVAKEFMGADMHKQSKMADAIDGSCMCGKVKCGCKDKGVTTPGRSRTPMLNQNPGFVRG